MMATQLLVVPRSMPMIFAISVSLRSIVRTAAVPGGRQAPAAVPDFPRARSLAV
jgi:hypothetical protein